MTSLEIRPQIKHQGNHIFSKMGEIQIFSIGVYGRTSDDFFNKLIDNRIDTFVDIRNRRAVRGSKYAFVNSKRLQNYLKSVGINYLHIIELAPTREIREIQKKADAELNVKKRERDNLSTNFVELYRKMVLDKFDVKSFIESLQNGQSKNVVLFCVEQNHQACHRSIVSEEIENKTGLKSLHL